ncbi:hypothetical protein OS175_02860 [Marinicella sp. S1101]|uniref:hypothetical protein n=1 Tax=Marinicella marina TaxID=2996016 RepID=UPI002260D79F|nr:hypothetical protein [Marinicella marina]MCX7552808.1 hypothetical protein [Marinicella marina]MDJ1139883.1 hypothetical protein [Marinicella marina]
MKITTLFALLLLTYLSNAQELSLDKLLCTADARNGLAIQQIDSQGNPVPFDCENIHVLILGKDYRNEKLPGRYKHCPNEIYQSFDRNDLISLPVSVMSGNPGIYQVTVRRFDEISVFKDILVEIKEPSCHAVGPTLEVQFDMTKRAKK